MRQSVLRLVARAAIAGASKRFGKADESSCFPTWVTIPRLGGSPQVVGTVDNRGIRQIELQGRAEGSVLDAALLRGPAAAGGGRPAELSDDAAAIADGDRVGPAAGLQLREQVAHVRLDRLLRKEEALADLAVDEAVSDELQHLDLT